jgi:hypothetical protein
MPAYDALDERLGPAVAVTRSGDASGRRMTENRPLDRRCSDAAILIVVSLVAGVAAGTFIYVLQTRFVHLLILYSLVMGAVVGLSMREAVYRWRIHAPLAAALIAGLGGATAWATPLAIGYAQYRLNVGDDVAAESVPAWIRGEINAGTQRGHRVREAHGSPHHRRVGDIVPLDCRARVRCGSRRRTRIQSAATRRIA